MVSVFEYVNLVTVNFIQAYYCGYLRIHYCLLLPPVVCTSISVNVPEHYLEGAEFIDVLLLVERVPVDPVIQG